ncbi:MAG: SMC-Scp complex subunit ScpB [Terracidiphilus sp.]
MSLKAKLEAVIYAAEEPVTLAQLAALFADEALAWGAEQQARVSSPAAGPLPLVSRSLAAEPEPSPWTPPKPGSNAEAAEPEPAPWTPPKPGSNAEAAEPEPSPWNPPTNEPEPEETAPPEPGSEADERRKARLRDREVRGILRGLLDELIAEYASDERGIEIREIAGGYRMATKPECHDAVRAFVRSLKPALKLSLPALETLAVVAYKQPVTAPEVSEIRGVESSGVLGSLLARKLIATAGRKPVIGRPILYKTTREFLLRFGLKDVNELPSMEEFEKMAATELDEPELAPASASAPRKGAEPALEFDESASEDSDAGPAPETESETESETAPEPLDQAPPRSEDSPQPHSAAQAETEEPHGNQA